MVSGQDLLTVNNKYAYTSFTSIIQEIHSTNCHHVPKNRTLSGVYQLGHALPRTIGSGACNLPVIYPYNILNSIPLLIISSGLLEQCFFRIVSFRIQYQTAPGFIIPNMTTGKNCNFPSKKKSLLKSELHRIRFLANGVFAE